VEKIVSKDSKEVLTKRTSGRAGQNERKSNQTEKVAILGSNNLRHRICITLHDTNAISGSPPAATTSTTIFCKTCQFPTLRLTYTREYEPCNFRKKNYEPWKKAATLMGFQVFHLVLSVIVLQTSPIPECSIPSPSANLKSRHKLAY
jgi:hypothetical protein